MPWTKVYTDKSEFEEADRLTRQGLRGLTYMEAIREALYQSMAADERVFLLGEGIDDPGGIFGTTDGLVDKFGKERVMDIPLAENGLTGIAMGAAMAGLRPVFIHMRMDFLPICMDQILNHIAKWSYMFAGKVKVPIVIRTLIGRGWGSAAQHSQSLHALFNHIPGLRVAMPASPYDAKGLLLASINLEEPVLMIEHRWLYDRVGHVPEERYEVPLGAGIIRRQGQDITVVAISQMVPEAIKAAETLAREGIEVEVIDPRTIDPLDEEMIFQSVHKTGKLIVADQGWRNNGVAAEISARVTENCFYNLTAPIARVTLPDVPTPGSCALENAFYIDSSDIVRTVYTTLQKAR